MLQGAQRVYFANEERMPDHPHQVDMKREIFPSVPVTFFYADNTLFVAVAHGVVVYHNAVDKLRTVLFGEIPYKPLLFCKHWEIKFK